MINKKNKFKYVVACIVILLVLVLTVYTQNLVLKSHIGTNYFNNFEIMQYYLGLAIKYLEQEEVTLDMANACISYVDAWSYTTTLKGDFNRTVLQGYYDINRIVNDYEFRDEVTNRLRAYHKALEVELENIRDSKNNHPITKINDFIARFTPFPRIDGKIYYDYLTTNPQYQSRYQFSSQIGQLLEKRFNENLD
ncbi:hypothetical protein F8154_06200 [Alkaliphilus pronyensis]|uniref:Uncharacterized protein n=1 Tax=Alkaliphilus pronyensis TaxID=1482732 RepID=A0A6I0F9B2_9FIRM|nr:hypothetical protein [Alkaliphilus pronyensis]KAB3535374.1 hypothetical protein F8154_06200 [Alkaliphilus pronyensis]